MPVGYIAEGCLPCLTKLYGVRMLAAYHTQSSWKYHAGFSLPWAEQFASSRNHVQQLQQLRYAAYFCCPSWVCILCLTSITALSVI